MRERRAAFRSVEIFGLKLDLVSQVRFTASMNLNCIHVVCRDAVFIGVNKHIKQMARQRCVVATGSSTG